LSLMTEELHGTMVVNWIRMKVAQLRWRWWAASRGTGAIAGSGWCGDVNPWLRPYTATSLGWHCMTYCRVHVEGLLR